MAPRYGDDPRYYLGDPVTGYEQTETKTVSHKPLQGPKAQPLVQGAPVPDDINLKPGRCSEENRQKAEDRLNELASQGYFDADPPGEADRRLEHARKAVTSAELNMLMSDLPAPPRPKRMPKPEREPKTLKEQFTADDSAKTLIAIIFTMVAGLALTIVPWVIAANIPVVGGIGYAIATVISLSGVGIVAGTIIWAGSVYG
jgi:hypothetical protein